MIFCKFSWSSCSISSLNSLPDGSTNFEKSFVAFILSIAVHLRDWLDAMFACPVKKHAPEVTVSCHSERTWKMPYKSNEQRLCHWRPCDPKPGPRTCTPPPTHTHTEYSTLKTVCVFKTKSVIFVLGIGDTENLTNLKDHLAGSWSLPPRQPQYPSKTQLSHQITSK